MALVVRDDADVIGHHLDHHLNGGVGHVYVTLHRASDATVDIVRGFERRGVVTVFEERGEAFRQAEWVTGMVRHAARTIRRGWVIHADADEFWFTTNGESLATWFRRRRAFERVIAPRHDMVCTPGDAAFWERCVHRKVVSVNALGRPLPGKVAHPLGTKAVVGHGSHAVQGIGPRWLPRRYVRNGVEILHVPARSREGFARKIAYGAQALRAHTDLDERIGATWRVQEADLERTGASAYLDTLVVEPGAVDELVADGTIVADPRLRDAFTVVTQRPRP